MTKKEWSSKIVNVIIIGTGVLMLGRGYISHYTEYALCINMFYSINIHHIDCYCIKGM